MSSLDTINAWIAEGAAMREDAPKYWEYPMVYSPWSEEPDNAQVNDPSYLVWLRNASCLEPTLPNMATLLDSLPAGNAYLSALKAMINRVQVFSRGFDWVSQYGSRFASDFPNIRPLPWEIPWPG